VTTMLDLSRLESGRLPLDVQEVRVAELLAEIQHDLAPECERSGLAL
jgi:signal transduction histidine kinase